jgi:site-specific DNA-methyltransferase (adenine-specific)
MQKVMQKENATILHGDCLEVLKTLPDNSVDAIVTDPPYGISFMAKKWDYDVPKCEVWREVLRVLKPGGHALVACGTRTQHRMAVNLEDAGFEVRDIVAWVYGSGFPKSLDIGKAIDKAAGAERGAIGESPNAREKRENNLGCMMTEEAFNITAPATDAAKQWDGWGTALKPAMELWTLCRKPLAEKTIAENVLTWGTGGLNINGCRVQTADNLNGDTYSKGEKIKDRFFEGLNNSCGKGFEQPAGRFPANLIHDGSDEVTAGFPQTSGGSLCINKENTVSDAQEGYKRPNASMYTHNLAGAIRSIGDNGSAARFFYCAKASKSERNAGLEGFEERHTFGDKGETYQGLSDSKYPNKNHHPTVKPLALMRYLCRLITPPNGTVLDPFTGSGSTGCGAVWEGFNFIGIERESDYAAIAQARITHAQKEKAADAASAQTNLF